MTLLRTKSLLFLAVAFVILAALPAVAQTTNARIEGIVTDASGAILPGVTITTTNLGTNASRTDVTDSKGAYSISALPVGNYRIRVELSGFTPQTSPVTLSVGQVARMDFKLQPGVSETVTVTAAAPLIDKSTSQISTLIDQKQIENLPLNGRNFTQLATLVPGVNRGIPGSNSAGGGSGTDAETFRYSEFGGAALSVNGNREQGNNFMIEGLDNNESLVNSIAYFPPPEAIREFSVITTNAPAEYGRASGAVQNLVIKSGTNAFSGSAYDYYRPKSLAATPYHAQIKPDFNNNDFGVTFGGPVFRDKLFFFGSYHGLRNSIPIEAGNYVTVPTDAMRNGDFSELLNPAQSGLSQPVIIYNPVTGQPFPNNQIPASMIDPVGKAYLNAFPHPTPGQAQVTHNYLTARQKHGTYNDFDARIDNNFTSADQLFASGSSWSDQFHDPGRIPGFQAGFGAGTSDNKGFTGRLGETHIFTENLVNELRFGTTNFHYDFLPVSFGTNQDAQLGIPGPGGMTTNNGISLIGGGNGTFIEYLGDFGQYTVQQRTLQVSDSVTWLRGNHAFKFGGTALRRSLEEINVNAGKGFYFFRDSFGFQQGFSGYEVADMLLNNAGTQFTATGIPGAIPHTDINWENALFAQDDWRVMPNLTLNLGLRWDLLTPYYEKDNKIANYDPVTQKLVLPGNGVPRSTRDTNYDNFGPRLGFDYLLNQKTAIRGGYGIFYSLDRGGIGNQLTQNPPSLVTQYRFSGPGSYVRLSQPIALPDPVDPTASSLPPGTGVIYIPRNSKSERTQEWNLSAQRELDNKTSAMLAYVGTRGSNLATVISSPGFGGAINSAVGAIFYAGTSKYDALQATMRRVENNGLSYLASYTLGSAKNDGPGFFAGNPSRGGSVTDSANCLVPGKGCNLGLDYGRADYDARQRLTVAATYALPWARENAIVGGWSVNTVLTLQSGTPFTVYDQSGKRADQVGNPNSGSHTASRWFNTSAFKPAAGAQGTEQRNAVTGPPTRTVDLSISKTFPVAHYGSLELRVEGTNIFNWAQYSQPDNVLGDPSFGKIFTTRLNSERQAQLAARYIF